MFPVSSNIPSIRDIARALDLSHTTVSQALRNKANVRLQTRQRVQAAAAAIGYHSNPLAGSLMADMRRRRGAAFSAELAVVDLDGPKGRPPSATAYHREIIEGAFDRAVELGVRPRMICTDNGIEPGPEGVAVMQPHDIHGALFLPVRQNAPAPWHNWSRCACIYADYSEGPAALHNICPDHFGAMQTVLRNLRAFGYQNPGLAIERLEDERLASRWSRAYWACQALPGKMPEIPPLLMCVAAREEFCEWFKKYGPDVVIGHRAEIMDWMRACGARIPWTHGFCCLNITKNPDTACAGVDQQPRMLGAHGVELVVALFQRGEFGIPVLPLRTIVPSVWVDGPTLRKAPDSGCRANK